MSEFINNHEFRQNELKKIIKKLHDGATVEEVKVEFDKLTLGVTATEITEMEQALVDEGMPVSEIQRLCDVHAAVFKGSIEDIHANDDLESLGINEGHPIHVLKEENRMIENLINNELLIALNDFALKGNAENKLNLTNKLETLLTIDKHYRRKENLIFPIMEKYDITTPPQVMWGVDDEIRANNKQIINILNENKVDVQKIIELVMNLVNGVREMIFKEEEILIPMIIDLFTTEDWVRINFASKEIGYTLIDSVSPWFPLAKEDNDEKDLIAKTVDVKSGFVEVDSEVEVGFDAGSLSAVEINSILNTIPLDMTFVDNNDKVKYFTQGKERVFDRPITIIGREVKNCHPPKSVHIVEQIVDDLKSGKKNNEDFWIRMGEMFVYIRYFAVRDKNGDFLGTLEVTQNIKPITELEGEKRLMSS